MRKRSRLLETTAVFVATFALASSAQAAVNMLESNVTQLDAPAAAQSLLPIIRGGFGGMAGVYGAPHT